jgi:hypothetical protein
MTGEIARRRHRATTAGNDPPRRLRLAVTGVLIDQRIGRLIDKIRWDPFPLKIESAFRLREASPSH